MAKKALKNQVLSALLTSLQCFTESNWGHTDFQSVSALFTKVNISNNKLLFFVENKSLNHFDLR